MQVNIVDIPSDGLRLCFDTTDSWASKAASAALGGALSDLNVELVLRRVGPGVYVEGRVSASVQRCCDRCLAALRYCIEGPVQLYYEPGSEDLSGDVNLLSDELEVGFFDGAQLDLSAVLSEFLALEASPRLFCGDYGVSRLVPGECSLPVSKGDSPESMGTGASDDQVGDPRFAVLKHLDLD